MKRLTFSVRIFSFVFLAVGLFWMASIYQRCEAIYPRRRPPKVFLSPKVPVPPPEMKKQDIVLIRFLSPHAKWYHFALFWGISLMELGIAFLFIFTGWAILRLFRKGWEWALTALIGDMIFKLAVGLYLHLCAIPLARLTDNKNNMLTYYMPDKSIYSTASSYLSGVKLYPPSGQLINAFIYAAFMLGALYYFSRKSVQEQFAH